MDPLIKSQLLYQLSYKSVVILINFRDFNAISRIRTYTPRLHAESSTSCRLMTAPSLQEEYQPQNTYSDIIVHERVSDSDGLFGSFYGVANSNALPQTRCSVWSCYLNYTELISRLSRNRTSLLKGAFYPDNNTYL